MVLQAAREWFWNPDVWLPPNVTWSDLVPNEKIQYTNHLDLYYPIPIAAVLLVLRYFLEKYCYAPFGLYLGIRPDRRRSMNNNPELERLYTINSKPDQKDVTAAAKLVSESEKQVARWFRMRRLRDRPSTLTKFCENSFRCTYYIYSFVYGLCVLWDKPWLWDIQESWRSYPHQSTTPGIWWYYMISLAFYWSLAFSQFFDVKHKDFWQMFVHHIATIFLMSFSWICNMTRVGSLVLVVHDSADILLEASKMALYSKKQRVCDTFFLFFTLTWLITRIGLFPFWIIRNTAIGAAEIVPMFPAYYIFNGLLILLLVLHLFWTYLILKMVYKSLLVGKMDGDIRSSSESESDESTNGPVQENGVKKAQ